MKEQLNQSLINDKKAEEYVVGSLLIDCNIYTTISKYLNEDCFYNEKCKAIWNVINTLWKQAVPVDLITVISELTKTKSDVSAFDLTEIVNNTVSSAHAEYHAIRLQDLSRRRKLWEIGQKLSSTAFSEVEETSVLQQDVISSISKVFDKDESFFTLTDALNSLSLIMSRNLSCKQKITGTKTGMTKFDEKGGLQGSDLIIIAGETSQGKTSLALSVIKVAIENRAKVAFYSMEMTKEQLTARLLSAKTNIPANDILYSSTLSSTELKIIDEAKGSLPGNNLFFDDKSTSNIDSILTSIRMMKLKYDIDGAAIDYLQILNVNMKNLSFSREQAMGDVARRLKNLAKELNIWIIALSQLSRDSMHPEPNLNRLRDSGQIGEAADVVLLVYRPEYYNRPYPAPFDNIEEYPTEGTAMIDVAKGRNIGTFKFFMGFNKKSTNFFNIDLNEKNDMETPIEDDAPF